MLCASLTQHTPIALDYSYLPTPNFLHFPLPVPIHYPLAFSAILHPIHSFPLHLPSVSISTLYFRPLHSHSTSLPPLPSYYLSFSFLHTLPSLPKPLSSVAPFSRLPTAHRLSLSSPSFRSIGKPLCGALYRMI